MAYREAAKTLRTSTEIIAWTDSRWGSVVALFGSVLRNWDALVLTHAKILTCPGERSADELDALKFIGDPSGKLTVESIMLMTAGALDAITFLEMDAPQMRMGLDILTKIRADVVKCEVCWAAAPTLVLFGLQVTPVHGLDKVKAKVLLSFDRRLEFMYTPALTFAAACDPSRCVRGPHGLDLCLAPGAMGELIKYVEEYVPPGEREAVMAGLNEYIACSGVCDSLQSCQ